MARKESLIEGIKNFMVGLGGVLGPLFCLAVGAVLLGIFLLLFHLAIPVAIILLVLAVICLTAIAICLIIKGLKSK